MTSRLSKNKPEHVIIHSSPFLIPLKIVRKKKKIDWNNNQMENLQYENVSVVGQHVSMGHTAHLTYTIRQQLPSLSFSVGRLCSPPHRHKLLLTFARLHRRLPHCQT
ncbi:Uncharacterized protein APZ42_025783 [Daphnia magna]|uniref:Uncharacterized protein n=1 Tax=Daphnia magna TaxID=35525 RepID=A0A164SU97_9CRUS|nr:Uncharacterized protein APZ42_025783 [Daphnia magna]